MLYVFLGTKKTRNYEVKYTNRGFMPAKLDLKNGDVVTFVNNSDLYFWPASDLHPSHLLYPEFDPKKALEKGETWKFVFRKSGTWGFHDHLDPTKRGEIKIGDDFIIKFFVNSVDSLKRAKVFLTGRKTFFDGKIKSCPSGVDFETGRRCWEAAISEVKRLFGVQASFDFLKEAISKNPEIMGTCHYYSEYIGFLVYEDYFKGDSPKVYESAEICGYGFYHALLQEWVSHNKNISESKDYCESLEKIPNLNFSKGNCIQGVGIGLTFMNASSFYGEDEKIISKSLEDCSLAFKDAVYNSLCSDGVFSGLAHLYFGDHGISLSTDDNNPFWVCNKFKGDIKTKCYLYNTEVVYYRLNKDFNRTVDFIIKSANREVINKSLERLGTTLYSSSNFFGNDSNDYRNCRNILNKEYYLSCFSGYIKRFIAVNVRKQDDIVYKQEVCGTIDLSAEEAKVCQLLLADFIKNNETGFK